MDKIEMVAALLERIRAEEEKKRKYNQVKESAIKKASYAKERHYLEFMEWSQPMPSNDKVKEACKLARALLLEVSKEAKSVY